MQMPDPSRHIVSPRCKVCGHLRPQAIVFTFLDVPHERSAATSVGVDLSYCHGCEALSSVTPGVHAGTVPAQDLSVRALASPASPRISLPCVELSYWVVTAYDSWTPP